MPGELAGDPQEGSVLLLVLFELEPLPPPPERGKEVDWLRPKSGAVNCDGSILQIDISSNICVYNTSIIVIQIYIISPAKV